MSRSPNPFFLDRFWALSCPIAFLMNLSPPNNIRRFEFAGDIGNHQFIRICVNEHLQERRLMAFDAQ